MKNKLLVIYVGVQGIRSEDIEEVVRKISTRITPTMFEGEIIVIPTQYSETRIECINPKYITDETLIQEHTKMMKELKEQLQHQLEQIKKENDE